MSAVDLYLIYKFLQELTTPWEKWDAYKLGLIDKDGQKIRKAETGPEKAALPPWKTIVMNLKRLIEKVPMGKNALVSYAAALWLLSEEFELDDIAPLEEAFLDLLKSLPIIIENQTNTQTINTVIEPGRYKHVSGDIIFIKESAENVGVVFGVPVFKVVDKVTDKEYCIVEKDLEKF